MCLQQEEYVWVCEDFRFLYISNASELENIDFFSAFNSEYLQYFSSSCLRNFKTSATFEKGWSFEEGYVEILLSGFSD